jgi:diguanylate cyclase (GGDEF)-like protein
MKSDRPSVLVVDNEPQVLSLIGEFLKDHPYELTLSPNGTDALKRLEKNEYNVVITDLRMNPVDGLQVLHFAKDKDPFCEIIMITAYPTFESSLEALRGKIFEYLEKPISFDRLIKSVQNAVQKNLLALENKELLDRLKKQNEQLEQKVEEATRELQQRTVQDFLTGLHNYRFFVNALSTEISRSIRYNRPLVLVMLDLDFFKDYNDSMGHLAGNEVLKSVGKIIRSSVRANDIICRYGGEEFAVILPETTKEEALPLAERIQNAVKNQGFIYPSPRTKEKTGVTISAGIAGCTEDADEYDMLVRKADAALYEAKNRGRDQVILASPEMNMNHEEN